jgi:hypothetical protein
VNRAKAEKISATLDLFAGQGGVREIDVESGDQRGHVVQEIRDPGHDDAFQASTRFDVLSTTNFSRVRSLEAKTPSKPPVRVANGQSSSKDPTPPDRVRLCNRTIIE